MKTIIMGAMALAAVGAWLAMRRRRRSERSEEGDSVDWQGSVEETSAGSES